MKKILLIALSLIVIGCGAETPVEIAAREKRECEDSRSIYNFSQQFVKGSLRSPSTGSFPRFSDSGVSGTFVTIGGNCRHTFNGYVDSQNGLGGTVRSRYTIKVLYEPKTKDLQVLTLSFQ